MSDQPPIPMDDGDLGELHVGATYALQAGCPRVQIMPSQVLQLIDEVQQHRRDLLVIAQALGIVYSAEGHAEVAGPVDAMVREVRELKASNSAVLDTVTDNDVDAFEAAWSVAEKACIESVRVSMRVRELERACTRAGIDAVLRRRLAAGPTEPTID